MKLIEVEGRVDDSHRLTADVPATVRPSAVTVRIAVPEEDEEEEIETDGWGAAVAAAWADEWSDPREDIYTLDHGQPTDSQTGSGHAAK